jgi:hypothetical protein
VSGCGHLLQVRQLFEELVVPFVLSHERVAAVLLGKAWNKMTQDDARDKLWQVRVDSYRNSPGEVSLGIFILAGLLCLGVFSCFKASCALD